MKGTEKQKSLFTRQLMEWHRTENFRILPWKEETDPYKIWLSEIILQQTRAEQGTSYYHRFITQYPKIEMLAQARDEEVFRLWQGLGYYNRCKNLLHTARKITEDSHGIFPSTYVDILALKGVGTYTAAAIASFAYNLPHAVVDGNVYRVLARYFGIATPVDTGEGKKIFQHLAQELLDEDHSAEYNQSIMDFGATICTPAAPKCETCPLQRKCIAYKDQTVNLLPVKSKKITIKTRHFHYILFFCEDQLWLRKRTGKDIWQNLYEPFLIEHSDKMDLEEVAAHPVFLQIAKSIQLSPEGSTRQKLTHQIIETHFFSVRNLKKANAALPAGEWIPISALKKIPFARCLVSFLEKKLYF